MLARSLTARRKRLSIVVAVVCLVAPSLRTTDARADDPILVESGSGRGEELFRKGRALMLDGHFIEACPMLEESNRLEPHVGTLLNLAACHERLGRLATAWAEYERALTAARVEGQSERESLARERIAVLEPRVPWLTVSVRPETVAMGVRVTLDGADLPPATWGKEMPVDPGPHTVTVGSETVERFELKEAEHRTVAVLGVVPSAANGVAERPTPPAVTPEDDASGFVLELGPLMGVIDGSEQGVAGADLSQVHVGVVGRQDEVPCTELGCRAIRVPLNGDWALGLTAFAGVATSHDLRFGVRAIGARGLGDRVNTARSMLVGGPGMLWRLYGPAWLGAAAVVGAGWHPGYEGVNRNGDGVYYSLHSGASTTGIALGANADVGLELVKMPRGHVMLTFGVTCLVGPTTARPSTAMFAPLGLTYRSR